MRAFWRLIRCGSYVIKGLAILICWFRVGVGPSLSIIQLPSPSIGYTGLIYRSFCYVVSSLLLNNGPDLWCNKRTFFNILSWSETDTRVLGVFTIRTKPVLGHDLRWRLLLHSSHLLRLLSKLIVLLLWTTLFRRRRLLWWRRWWIRASTFLYSHNQGTSKHPALWTFFAHVGHSRCYR